MKGVERESGGEVRLEIGSLHRLLAGMLDDGLIEEADGDGRRCYYRISRLGSRVVRTATIRMDRAKPPEGSKLRSTSNFADIDRITKQFTPKSLVR
jgi:DNA-binding PadR family transcriptional regulator